MLHPVHHLQSVIFVIPADPRGGRLVNVRKANHREQSAVTF